jgi:hypothetical protein
VRSPSHRIGRSPDVAVEALGRVEDRLGRDEAPRAHALRERPHEPRRASLDVEEVLHEEAQHVREPQHAQRGARGRAVDDADVEVTARLDVAHRAQRHELLEPREDQQLLGSELAVVAREQRREPGLDLRPRAVELRERGHLLRDDALGDLDRARADGPAERVAEAVGRIGRHHADAVAVLGSAQR